MRYLSVCSGIEAASVAWHPFGWEAVAYSEVEPFPCSVLAHHYPRTPNWGDMTKWENWPDATVDVLVGGTPCQSYSVAGKRAGMDDPRGRLALSFSAIASKYKPRWIVWENVPGVLSSGQGRDFGSFLGSLAELGYGLAYRVLDAQWFGLAQRRKRVFVVGCLGDWRRAAAVLFESQGLCRNSEKGRKKEQGTTGETKVGTITSSLSKGTGHNSQDEMIIPQVVPPLTARMARGRCTDGQDEKAGYPHLIWSASDQVNAERLIDKAGTLNCNQGQRGGWIAKAFYPSEVRLTGTAGLHDKARTLTSQTKQGDTEPHAVVFMPHHHDGARPVGEIMHTLKGRMGTGGGNTPMAAIGIDTFNGQVTGDLSATVTSRTGIPDASGPRVLQSTQIRRLTPRECERLQGFPDDYTQVPHRGKPAADGPRYKALGNSMAVPCMAWIGRRIDMVSKLEGA